MNLMTGFGVGIVAILSVVVISFLLSFPAWLLWNYCLVGAITGVNPVTWPQAWGISLLCAFLFKDTNKS